MTTIQPRLVRADTLDLQSQHAPSAQDHTRSPTFVPYTHGAAGSHHREALRNAEESAYNDRKSSPRMSTDDAGLHSASQVNQYDSTDDDGDDEQHDGMNANSQNEGDYEDGNDENDEDLEEDLLDKISSSPSIEDGKYSPSLWPPRVDSIASGAPPASSTPSRGNVSLHLFNLFSSPQMDLAPEACQVGRHLSKDSSDTIYDGQIALDASPGQWEKGVSSDDSESGESNSTALLMKSHVSYADDIEKLLFPVNDPILDGILDADEDADNEEDWVDEGEPWFQDESSSDDDLNDSRFSEDSRFIDSGWGGECLREIEDIDFEFVYALHTFVATVEGQANATKGDTMVLLDDSNSYWWLVRVVKDGSIGYLPAEHIETPTERLARLNKHRNIDLSASMLGDNPEKSKNPLKKAMRRRNAKTVAFAAPTYYEPSEYEYDSEDEEEEGIEGFSSAQSLAVQEPDNGDVQEGQVTDLSDSIIIVNGIKNVDGDDQVLTETPTSPVKAERSDLLSPQTQLDENLQRSRNGVVRNTDSFFKDDTVETKKISLTPRLLRNDADSTANSDSDLRSKTSSETFDKMLGPDDKSREKEKKREKKGMLSGLFKRKDKSAKSAKSDTEEERAEDGSRAAQPKDSVESVSGPQSPDRKPGKLQKNPPAAGLAIRTSPTETRQQPGQTSLNKSPLQSPIISETPTLGPGMEPQITVSEPVQTEQTPNRFPSLNEKRNMFAPITNVLKSTPSDGSTKPIYSKRAKERFAIDGSDSDDDHTPTMSQISQSHRDISPMRNSQLEEPRPDSVMEVSPVEQSDTESEEIVHSREPKPSNHVEEQYTPIHDVRETPQSDTASTSKPSPSLATHTPSTSRSTPTWSDASLRSYMESDQDIRDLLIIVHDKTNVTPVGPDHPLMGGLFTNERTRLTEMQTQLDSMLTTWITKKNPGLLSR